MCFLANWVIKSPTIKEGWKLFVSTVTASPNLLALLRFFFFFPVFYQVNYDLKALFVGLPTGDA